MKYLAETQMEYGDGQFFDTMKAARKWANEQRRQWNADVKIYKLTEVALLRGKP